MAKKILKAKPIDRKESLQYKLASKLNGRVVIDDIVILDTMMIYELLCTTVGNYLYARMLPCANNKANISLKLTERLKKAPEGSLCEDDKPKFKANKLIDMVNESDPQRKSSKPRRNLIKSPSQRFLGWKERGLLKWLPTDFFGYYLFKFTEMNGYEDDMFIGSVDFKRYVHQTKLCWELHFDGDHERFKEYIDTMFEWFSSNDCWVKAPNFNILLRSSGNIMMKEYKKLKKSKQGLDKKWSSNKSWSNKAGVN